jgi:hypothetical protein
VSVFCQPTSEFIRMLRYFRKTMVASKDTRNYIGSDRSTMSSFTESSSVCSSVECSEVLTMGCVRRGKEVGEW